MRIPITSPTIEDNTIEYLHDQTSSEDDSADDFPTAAMLSVLFKTTKSDRIKKSINEFEREKEARRKLKKEARLVRRARLEKFKEREQRRAEINGLLHELVERVTPKKQKKRKRETSPSSIIGVLHELVERLTPKKQKKRKRETSSSSDAE